ncbi:MAG: type IV secretion system DNA-binding domain-containing protein [Prochloraceae cyanobacterium]|nr:type IV secretion system DNA-binding domain-containing protein [Prochloraceae cyanobacterium]
MSQKLTRARQYISVPSINDLIPTSLQKLVSEPQFILLFVLIVCYALLSINNKSKTQLAHARWGGAKERLAARKLACQQIEEGQRLGKLALFIGTPRGTRIEYEWDKPVLYLPSSPRTIYLANCQKHLMIIGSTGEGKSFSAVSPAYMSAVLQGTTIFFLDAKGHEVPSPADQLVSFAVDRGYKVWYIDIESELSSICNIMDFIESPVDSENAHQLGDVLIRNFKIGQSDSGNSEYFALAGVQLMKAILLMAKDTPLTDLATVHKILSLPNLIERLHNAKLPQVVKVAFDNFLSTAGAPETAAGVASTASLLLTRFMNPKVLRTFCGNSTMPLDFDGRNLVVFKMNSRNKAISAPLISATLEMLITRNIYRPRNNFLTVFGDEINSVFLPNLVDWLNQLRSSKLCFILGVQSLGFLEKVYGKEAVSGILAGCGTQVIFAVNDNYTAEYYSKKLGEKEVKVQQKSHSYGKNNNSHSSSDNLQTRPLMTLDEFDQLLTGQCVILSSGSTDGVRKKIPLKQKVNIPTRDIKALKKSEADWKHVQPKMLARNERLFKENGNKKLALEEFYRSREQLAYNLLPTAIEQETRELISSY